MKETDVCIAGAGPAGMLLGLLLARVGVRVLVLEQHKNFDREYRGEVLMPRFTRLFRQLGLSSIIENSPHLKLDGAEIFFHEYRVGAIDFAKLSPEIPYALWLPQPVLLQALHEEARKYPSFEMWFDTSARSLLREGERTVGLKVKKGREDLDIRAKITVGADGRFSAIRRCAKFKAAYTEHQFDIIWFTIAKPANYVSTLRFYLSRPRNLLVLPKYPDSIQCGLVVPKGEFADYKKRGIDSIRQVLLKCHPLVHEFARKLKDFGEFNVLQAELELIENWELDGLLLVGDSAHTMSPAGAIGVSVAAETAAVAAGVIYRALEKNDVSAAALDQVQKIRAQEVRDIHKIQNRFANLLLARNPLVRTVLPMVLPMAFRLPAGIRAQKRLAVLSGQLPLDPGILPA